MSAELPRSRSSESQASICSASWCAPNRYALRLLMLPKDPNDGRAVIMEIRGAEGGEEANLFAGDLYDMYRSFASAKGWQVEVLSEDRSDLGGINLVTMLVRGDTVWSRMKFEGGTHRVQRVPVTESQGRIHTSSATVTVPRSTKLPFLVTVSVYVPVLVGAV